MVGGRAIARRCRGFLKLILSVAVVLLPAFAMGTTLPLMVRAASNDHPDNSSVGGWFYAFNTIGGLVGLCFTAGYTLYAFGVSGALIVPILLNVVVGLMAMFLDRLSSPHEVDSKNGAMRDLSRKLLNGLEWKLLVTAFSSGFLILGLEIMAMELVMLVAPISIHAPFATASFILALSVSALYSFAK